MASWELSPLYRHSASLLLPDGLRLVSQHRDRIVLRAADSLQVLRTWTLALANAACAPTRPAGRNPALAQQPDPVQLTAFAVAPAPPYHVLCYPAGSRTAWVLDPDNDEPAARLDIGNEGAVALGWAQVERESVVLSWSAHRLRLSLYRLSAPTQALHILNPKVSGPRGCSFRPDGAFFAVLERHNSRDTIGVYSTQSWSLIRSVPLEDPTSDLADLTWSPCGRFLAAWSSVTEYLLHLFSPDGRLLYTFTPYSSLSPAPSPAASSSSTTRATASRLKAKTAAPPSTEKEHPQSAHDRLREERSTAAFVGLGIRSVQWAPSGDWLAVGGYDGKIRILTRHGWVVLAELGLPTKVVEPAIVWREPAGWVEKTRGKGIVSFESTPLPHSLTPVQPSLTSAEPKMGVARIEWSASGRWLAAWDASHPHIIAIYRFGPAAAPAPTEADLAAPSAAHSSRARLHTILEHAAPPSPTSSTPASQGAIRSFAWQPRVRLDEYEDDDAVDAREETLVVLTGEKGFTQWRSPVEGEEGKGLAECVGIPTRADVLFPASSLAFSRDGRALLLSAPPATGAAGEGTFCLAYPVYDEQLAAGDDGEAGRTWLSEDDRA